MYRETRINPKLLLFFIVAGMILFSIILITLIISFSNEGKISPSPKERPAPTSVTQKEQGSDELNPLQKEIIGTQINNELESRSDYLGKQTLPSGEIEYSFQSEIDVRPATIVTDKDGKVVFERIMIPEEPDATGYVLISDYKKKYGEPEADIQGSRFYEWAIHTYIYASKGFALIGNPNTDEVFEIHSFQPMSVEEYKTRFGQDLNPGAEHQPETWEGGDLESDITPAL